MKCTPVLLLVSILSLTDCTSKPVPASSVPLTSEEATAAGVRWSHPRDWSKQHDLPMRVVTYLIPSKEGVSSGECGVFYFGKNQGGDVDANMQRWGSQFEGASQAEKTGMTVQGMPVTVVKIAGTYLAPGGPMMESQGKKENYKLLGAIVEAPDGMLFFKCTGPAETIDAAGSAFAAMVQSLQKQ